MADYKEGKDFEMRKVKGKDGKVLHTTRHFFTKAEKEAAKKPPVAVKPVAKASKPTKTPSAPAPKARPKTKPDNTKEVVSRASAAIDRATKGGAASGGGATGRWEAPNKTPPKPTSKPINKLSGVTESEWDAMSRPERSGKGLPVSWIDYVKAGGDAVVKKPKPVVAKVPNRMEAFKLQQKK